ncbi:MAG TPA: hypothetical protein PK381_01435 [Anaerolineaceae bacterium]|nr:hypothetical protein [Anaerolineaceae bacterium]
MKKFFSILMAIALVLVILPVSGAHAQAQKPVAFESSIQIRNLSAEDGFINLTFFNLSGYVVGSEDVLIAGDETLSFLRSTMPIAPGFDGSVVVASNVPTAGMSNLHGLRTATDVMTYGAFNAFDSGAPAVYLPTLMKDNWGYDTFFYVQNLGEADADITVTYSDGLVVTKNGVKPGASAKFDQTLEEHAGKVFAATVEATQDIAATVAQNGATLLTYNSFAEGSVYPVMPLVQENHWGYFSGIQIQNIGTDETQVTVTYTPSLYGTACTETQTIPAGESTTFGEPAFYRDGSDTTCIKGEMFVGSAAVTVNNTAQPLVAVVNQLNNQTKKGGAYNAFDPATGGSGIIYPLIMDRNWDYFTSWSIVNVGVAEIAAEAIVCQVTGTDKNGAPVNVQLVNAEAVEVGASWTLEHKGLIADGFVGGATCTVTGGKVIGTANQFANSPRWTGKDTLLVYEGFIIP